MARHRRYPQKKTNKIRALKEEKNDKKQKTKGKSNRRDMANIAQIDEQPIPRKLREINEMRLKAEQINKVGRKKKSTNRFFEETAKLGYQRRPWEDEDLLMSRINRDANKQITDQLIKAQVGTAGRKVEEIAADYKELDKKEQRRKLQKIARTEKLKKLKEKEQKFKESRKGKEEGPSLSESEESEESGEEGDQSDDEEHQSEGGPKNKQQKKQDEQVLKKKRLGKNDKLRLKRKQLREDDAKELILNAREVIPFGERVDAPPTFDSFHRKQLARGFAHAGKKDLLLKKLLSSGTTESNNETEEKTSRTFVQVNRADKKRKKVTEEDRRQAIDAYRNHKKARGNASTSITL